MFHLIRFLFRPGGVALIALAALGLGAYGLIADPEKVPAREELKTAAGRVVSATKVTSKHDSVRYKIDVKDDAGTTTTYQMRADQIGEDAIRTIIDEPVTLGFTGTSDVWELSSGKAALVTYEASKAGTLRSQRELHASAPYIAVFGVIAALGAAAWWRRRGKL